MCCLLENLRRDVLTINDIGAVELRVVGDGRVEFGVLHVVFDVPTLVLVKRSKYHAPLFIRPKLHASADPIKEKENIWCSNMTADGFRHIF